MVPTYNRAGQVEEVLSSLVCQQVPPPLYEVVIVDDGSDPPVQLPFTGTDSLEVRLLRQPNRGAAAARNLGAAQARGRYLVFTDDDCRPEPGWLASFAQRGEQLDRGTLLVGSTHNAVESNTQARFNQGLADAVAAVAGGTPAAFCVSNNFCVRKAEYEALGGFDESFPSAGGEDREFSARWLQSGRPIQKVGDARLWHCHAQTIGEFWTMHYRYGAGARNLSQMHPGLTTSLDKAALLRETLRRTGPGGIALFALSQLATAAGFYARELRGALLYALCYLGFFAILTLVAWLSGAYRAELAGADESAHAVTSVMVREYLLDGLWKGLVPLDFAQNYYASYPRVAIGHWPPGLYALAAPWLMVFGVSRASFIVFTTLIAAALCLAAVVLCRRAELPWPRAIGSGLAVALLPPVSAAALALNSDALTAVAILAAAIFGDRWIRRQDWRSGAVFGLACAVAVLIKGNAFVLAPAAAIAGVARNGWRACLRPRFLVPALPVVLLAGPWYWFTREIAGAEVVPGRYDSMIQRAAFCLGANLKLLFILGGVVFTLLWICSLRAGWWRNTPVAAALVPASLVFLSFLSPHAEDRLMLAVCPVVVFGALWVLRERPFHVSAAILLVGVVLSHVLNPLSAKPENGFVAAAAWMAGHAAPGDTVLVVSPSQGEGALIAELALKLPEPAFRVVRGTKVFQRSDWNGTDVQIIVGSQADVGQVIARERTRWVVTDAADGFDSLPYGEWLGAALSEWSTAAAFGGVRVYQPKGARP